MKLSRLTMIRCILAVLLLTRPLRALEILSLQPATTAPAPLPVPVSAKDTHAVAAPATTATPLKQPVFLICPSKESYSAWSIFVVVDKNDSSKVVSLGLETLKNLNAKDSSYDQVLRAQSDEKAPREALGVLPSSDFGRREITVAENDSLHLALSPAGPGEFSLMVSMRVGWSDRFVIGGKERGKKEIVIKFNKDTRQWRAYPRRLVDTDGADHADEHAPMPGIVFPVAATGIYRVFGVLDNGETVLLMDR